jgi:hypothetical protein
MARPRPSISAWPSGVPTLRNEIALTNLPSPERKRARMWFSPTGST